MDVKKFIFTYSKVSFLSTFIGIIICLDIEIYSVLERNFIENGILLTSF